VGLMIPGELADLLNELGYTWPKSDEEKLFQLGQDWIGFAGTLASFGQEAQSAASLVYADNSGASIEAFVAKWQGDDSPVSVLADGEVGAQVLGACVFVCAGVVLALKINVIVQLTILLIEIIQAIATSVPTCGASLLEIPAFKKLTDMLINFLISKAMEVLLG
jgi:hypothetical protein